MSKETEGQEEKNKGLNSFSEENMFDSDSFINAQEEQEFEDLKEFDGVNLENENEKENHQEEKNEDDNNEEDDNDLNFEDEEENEDDFELDIESFNKKFNKDFKSQEELNKFLNDKEEKENTDDEENQLVSAQNQLDILEKVIVLADEDLMRKEFETIALNSKKDLNNEDVQIEINEKIERLKDEGTLDVEARKLRRSLDKIIDSARDTKKEIESKREERKAAEEKSAKEELQNQFAEFYGDKFYGVDLDKKVVEQAYREAASGKLIENLTNNKKELAELALMRVLKKEIFKKASGLTYNDGVKSIVDDFKSKQKDSPAVKAQARGTSVNNKDAQKGLIDSILYTKPVDEEK